MKVNDDMANAIIAQLLFLDAQDPEKISIWYINSPGGSVSAGLAIYDTMNFVNADVRKRSLWNGGFNGVCFELQLVLKASALHYLTQRS